MTTEQFPSYYEYARHQAYSTLRESARGWVSKNPSATLDDIEKWLLTHVHFGRSILSREAIAREVARAADLAFYVQNNPTAARISTPDGMLHLDAAPGELTAASQVAVTLIGAPEVGRRDLSLLVHGLTSPHIVFLNTAKPDIVSAVRNWEAKRVIRVAVRDGSIVCEADYLLRIGDAAYRVLDRLASPGGYTSGLSWPASAYALAESVASRGPLRWCTVG